VVACFLRYSMLWAPFVIRHSCFVIGANLILSKNLASSI
jgi:hypothetical protein